MNTSLYDYYQLYLYAVQQKFYNYLGGSILDFRLSTAVLLFFIGGITTLTPCFVSIVPLSMAYINSRNQSKYSKNIFIAGILSSVLLISFILNIFNYKYIGYIIQVPILSSVLLSLIALSFLQVFSLSILNINTNLWLNQINQYVRGNIYDYLTGCLIGMSALPCSSSVIYIIIFWLSKSINIEVSFLYLFCYILGYTGTIIIVLDQTITYINIYFLSYIWELIVPFSGFIILTIALFNILQQLFY